MNIHSLSISAWSQNIINLYGMLTGDSGNWSTLAGLLQKLLPILWISTAIFSTIWLVIKVITATYQSASGEQDKYEKARKARNRALYAWFVGLLWPVIFIIAYELTKLIAPAVAGKDINLPDLF